MSNDFDYPFRHFHPLNRLWFENKSIDKVVKVGWTSQLSYEILRSSLERKSQRGGVRKWQFLLRSVMKVTNLESNHNKILIKQ